MRFPWWHFRSADLKLKSQTRFKNTPKKLTSVFGGAVAGRGRCFVFETGGRVLAVGAGLERAAGHLAEGLQEGPDLVAGHFHEIVKTDALSVFSGDVVFCVRSTKSSPLA